MESLKSLAQGFLAASGVIWIFSIFALGKGGDTWLGLLYLLILLIPIISSVILWRKNKTRTKETSLDKWRNRLFALQGIALACWMFDIATTFYAINITGLAVEINPLGWPLGVLGALAFYGPAFVFLYILLYRLKDKVALYGAIPLTFLVIFMATMNLNAGAQNFQIFVDTTALTANIRYLLLALLISVNLTIPVVLKRTKIN